MTMENSTTKNVPTLFDLEKIKRFATEELAKLNNQELPFCYQIGTDLIVGKYKIKKINDNCWRVLENDLDFFDFYLRKNAIFYCILQHKNQLQIATELKSNDQVLGKLELDAIQYRHRYNQAILTDDTFKTELYSSRYLETVSRIDGVKKQIKKTFGMAKYIKV